MSRTDAGVNNIYFEMESKKETEAGTYEEVHVADESKTPTTKRLSFKTFAPGIAEKKRRPMKDAETAMFQRMLLIIAAVVAVAFLTAVATLVLALAILMSRNDSTASNDSTDVSGKRIDFGTTLELENTRSTYVNFTHEPVNNSSARLPATFFWTKARMEKVAEIEPR